MAAPLTINNNDEKICAFSASIQLPYAQIMTIARTKQKKKSTRMGNTSRTTHTDRPEYQVKFNVLIFTRSPKSKRANHRHDARASQIEFRSPFFTYFSFFHSFQDYHVFFMHNPAPTRCLIFDLDTTLPFPTYFHKYVTETFRSDLALRPEHHRYVLSFLVRQCAVFAV